MTRTRLALLAAALWPAVGLAVDPKADVPRLVEQLADPDYATREAATKRLNDLGAPALAALRTAAESGTLERAERAAALVARITRRIENEQALAPTVVELPATEQTVRELFDAIEKQSRVQLRIDGDQAILTQKLTPAGGKRPLWEHIQDVATKAGLGMAEVSDVRPFSRSEVYDKSPPLPEPQLHVHEVRKQLAQCKSAVSDWRPVLASLKKKLAGVKTANEKAKLSSEIEELTALIQKNEAQAEKLEAQVREWEKRPLLGVVKLKAGKPTPACASGAVRVEVMPASADLLKRYTPGHLPLAVKLYAEPKLEWYRVTETAVIEAVGPDGQPAATDSFTPRSFNTLANDELQFRRARLGLRDGEVAFAPATVGLAALAAPVSGKPLTLKSVRGVVRGTVWTEPGEVVSVTGLGEKYVAAASGHTSLTAKVLPPAGFGRPDPQVEVTLQFDPTAVRVQPPRTASDDAVWLENGPGGRVVPRPVRAKASAPRPVADQHGLLFADADGEPLDMAPQSATTYQLLRDGRYMTVVSRTYAARNTPANAGRAVAKVSFHGTQQKQVSVPFRFTDVTLTPGTGDGQPLPEDYETRWKK